MIAPLLLFRFARLFLSEVSWDLWLGSIDLEWQHWMPITYCSMDRFQPVLLENQLLVNYCQLVSFSVHSRQQQQKSRAKEHKKSIAKQKARKKEKGSPRVNGQQQQQQRTMQKGKTKSMHKKRKKQKEEEWSTYFDDKTWKMGERIGQKWEQLKSVKRKKERRRRRRRRSVQAGMLPSFEVVVNEEKDLKRSDNTSSKSAVTPAKWGRKRTNDI